MKVFIYELDKRFIKSLFFHLQWPPQTEAWESIMPEISNVDYHETILAKANLNQASIQKINKFLLNYGQ
jgi:predicted NUDIX family NTP pyrophosphohydrolase